MRRGPVQDRFVPVEPFDMTPIIDVVFLLIIFFMLVCQFIAAENFEVAVPEEIGSARPVAGDEEFVTTVTVMKDASGRVQFAVGSEVLGACDLEELPGLLSLAIDAPFRLQDSKRRVVRLRCDKSLPFGTAKYALSGIVQSSATDIQWAVIGGPQGEGILSQDF